MASIAIVGKTGTGKSTSYGQIPELNIEGLDPIETTVINVSRKDLPFRGWQKKYGGRLSEGGNYFAGDNANDIVKVINYINNNRPEMKNIVIDDGQYIMAFEFMRNANETGYKKFAVLGVNMSKVIEAARTTRPDLKVYFLWHPDQDKDTGYKMKTVGVMIDSYLTLEGLFTVVLYSRVTKNSGTSATYEFVTNNDGEFPAKSPVGMFKELYIPNDLAVVSRAIDDYNSFEE